MKKLTKEDVWGTFDANHKLVHRGMIVAQGMPSNMNPAEKKKIQDEIKVSDVCPVWKDILPYKSVTVVCDVKQRDEVIGWLSYVHGGDCIAQEKALSKGMYAIRSDYQCW